MSRFMLLDRGEELSEAALAARPASTAPLRLKLLGALPPFVDADVLHVRHGADHGGAGRLLLCRDGSRFTLASAAATPPEGVDVVGLVTGLERGELVVALDRGFWRRVPPSYWPPLVHGLELLRRCRHPLTPPLFQGAADDLLDGVRDKYDAPVETVQYGAFATGELETIERELIEAHVPRGGRILDIGCGGGREAVGFARLGYRVVAIDIAPGMIEAARRSAARLGVAIDFRVQSVTTLEKPPGSFDGAFFGRSLHHVPGRVLRIATLRRLARALSPDGVLILMVVYREGRGLLSRSRLVDAARRIGRAVGVPLSEPGDGYMRDVSEGGDSARLCFFHHYDRPADVGDELRAAGFAAQEAAPCWWVCRPAPEPLC